MRLAPMFSGLQRRLLLLLMVPLCILAGVNTWFDYRSARNAALQQDQQLLELIPLLADSVLATGSLPDDPPVMLTAPPVEEFLKARVGSSAYAVATLSGKVLLGEPWLSINTPEGTKPVFRSWENDGVTFRVIDQRAQTAAGELVVSLADGSDPRQQWVQLVLVKVFLPNFILMILAVFAVNFAVKRALRPLMDLRDAVEHRSPRDLSPMDVNASPEEVRPLVQSLNRLFGLVSAQAESQRRFVADAAHQLRTPLAGLQSQIEAWAQAVNIPTAASAWREKYEPNQGFTPVNVGIGAIYLRADQLNHLRDAARRTSKLANQLLALSRADARSLSAQHLERVDLKELCEIVLETHLDAATDKFIDLGLDVSPVYVSGQEWLLRELLNNLVHNALKYIPVGGSVTIRCHRSGPAGEAVLEVEDDGPGIPAAERSQVLERFYRVKGTLSEGNGLGLAIAEEIARAHHSQLIVGEGAGGTGARISLVFPL